MALQYDQNGYVIGDDGNTATDPAYNGWGLPVDTSWDSAADPAPPTDVEPGNLSYFQQKLAAFQGVLNGMDATYTELTNLLGSGLNSDDAASVQAMLDEFTSRKAAFSYAAEAYNFVANAVTSAGGALPSLAIPQSLGFLPAAIPMGYVAAIATAAVLIGFGLDWMTRASTLSQNVSARYLALANATTDPTEKTRLLNLAAVAQQSADNVANAQNAANTGGVLGQLANIIKWVAIGAGVYLLYDAYTKSRR